MLTNKYRTGLLNSFKRLKFTENVYSFNYGYANILQKQWLKNKGKCGICGDPFDGPRSHEHGEKYDHKFISRTFKQNEIINVTVEITKDLSGYIEFRICDNSNDDVITVDCLDKNVLEIGDTKYKQYKVWNSGYHVIPIQLPENLTCDKCLLQFRYHTGK